jgi:AcrR family transcriptional regulator
MSVKGLSEGRAGTPGRRRARNPQGQGARLRADLIAAADGILARTGDVEGLSLRAVAREVGIATPSIYLHFPDKSALIHAVLSVRFAELGDAVRAAVTEATGPAGKLRAGCLAYCRFATEHPNAYRVLFGRLHSPTPRPPPSLPPWGPSSPRHCDGEGEGKAHLRGSVPESLPSPDHPGAAAFGFLVEGVSVCMRAGIAPADDPFRVATNVWTALHGIVSLRGSAPGFPWPSLERQIDDVLTGMVGLRHNPPPIEG